ncbi:MAG: glycosyltransferase involved in cell wall biosynthesis, partial [Oleiphilaceae bacterium]
NVEHALRWLGAIYDENEIAPYMLASSLCCYPANVGLSMMHAMGYGVPVITGDDIKSHNPEIHVLDNGLNGSLFLHLDTKDLAKKIIEILDNEKQLSLMGKNARKTVLNGFMTQDMVKGFMGAIRAIYHGY